MWRTKMMQPPDALARYAIQLAETKEIKKLAQGVLMV
jgi:hypothetical protein